MTVGERVLICVVLFGVPCVVLADPGAVPPTRSAHFVADSLRGTLARDHASRLVHHKDMKDRSYVTYLDHYHDVMVTCFDHGEGDWLRPVRVDCAPIRDGHATSVQQEDLCLGRRARIRDSVHPVPILGLLGRSQGPTGRSGPRTTCNVSVALSLPYCAAERVPSGDPPMGTPSGSGRPAVSKPWAKRSSLMRRKSSKLSL